MIIGAIGEYDQTIVRAAAVMRPTSTTWDSLSATIDVPADARTVGIGIVVVGTGECRLGDMHEELTAIPDKTLITVKGLVSTADGKPADHILVGVFAGEDLVQTATCAGNGEFSVTLQEGAYSFTASDDRAFGQTDEPMVLTKGASVTIAMRNPASLVSISGTVSDGDTSQPIIVSTGNGDQPARAIVRPGANGRFVAWLPSARFYWAFRPGDTPAIGRKLRQGSQRSLSLGELVIPRRMTSDIADWISQQSIPLGNVDVKAPLPSSFDKLLNGKTVVVAGEATHGSAEFSLLKQRIFRSLVENHGFRVLAMEISPHDCEAASGFLEKGQGSVDGALAAFSAWPWKTLDIRNTFLWMREWNTQHSGADRLRLICFDVQSSVGAYTGLERFLRCAAPEDAEALLAPFSPLGPNGVGVQYEQDVEARKKVWNGLQLLHGRFAEKGHAWIKACGADAVTAALDNVRQLEEAHGWRLDAQRIRNPKEGWVSRDRSMAENIVRAVSSSSGQGVFAWTHNVHASMEADGYESMGAVLRHTMGTRVLLIGMAFDSGSFQAVDLRPETVNGWIRRFEVPSLDGASLGAALASIALRLGSDVLALDLRGGRPAAVSAWLAALRPAWELGAVYGGPSAMTIYPAAVERFDLLLFVRQVTRAVPIH